MVQMVENLVNNALKFTPPGGEVHVGIRRSGVACEISVRDNGIGIDPHDLDSIFDPFVQAERSLHGARGGLGIGLALVRELALGHGGWVRARSAGPGQGTEFVLMLPLAVGQADAVSSAGAEEVEPRASGLSNPDRRGQRGRQGEPGPPVDAERPRRERRRHGPSGRGGSGGPARPMSSSVTSGCQT